MRENDEGEWTVGDRDLGYRLCAYHRQKHPTPHVHVPLVGPSVADVRPMELPEGYRLVQTYATRHDHFALDAFLELAQ